MALTTVNIDRDLLEKLKQLGVRNFSGWVQVQMERELSNEKRLSCPSCMFTKKRAWWLGVNGKCICGKDLSSFFPELNYEVKE